MEDHLLYFWKLRAKASGRIHVLQYMIKSHRPDYVVVTSSGGGGVDNSETLPVGSAS